MGHQDTLDRRLMIDLVVISSDLQLYVLHTRVKRGAELSADHHLVLSWIHGLSVMEAVSKKCDTENQKIIIFKKMPSIY